MPSSMLEPESVPDPVQTPKRIRYHLSPRLSTCPAQNPPSLSALVGVGPSVLEPWVLAFERWEGPEHHRFRWWIGGDG